MQLPRISIVTPSFNQAEFLEDCITSVLGQGYPNLEYVIMDGGSTDGSVEIIKKYEPRLSYWQSRPDGGHYAAVADGFGRTTGDVMAWLNSDDKFCPLAFFKAAFVFLTYPHVHWMAGRPLQWSVTGEADELCADQIVYSRERMVIRRQFQTPFIQQESTFWRRSLWERAGGGPRSDLELAGDFELWVRFFRYEQLQFVDTLIGGNRRHDKQRSIRFRHAYLREAYNVLSAEAMRPAPDCPSSELPPLMLPAKAFRGFLVEAGVPGPLIDSEGIAADLRANLVQLTIDHLDQVEAARKAGQALLEAEADRRNRLDTINALSARLTASDADRDARLQEIHEIGLKLAESEADRAARLQEMQRLGSILDESETDRAARLRVIEALERQLSEMRMQTHELAERIQEMERSFAWRATLWLRRVLRKR